jgi:hypothetical protein
MCFPAGFALCGLGTGESPEQRPALITASLEGLTAPPPPVRLPRRPAPASAPAPAPASPAPAPAADAAAAAAAPASGPAASAADAAAGISAAGPDLGALLASRVLFAPGLGSSPEDVLAAVAEGVDLLDCSYVAQVRHAFVTRAAAVGKACETL